MYVLAGIGATIYTCLYIHRTHPVLQNIEQSVYIHTLPHAVLCVSLNTTTSFIFENLGTEEELFIEVVEHNHTEEHRDILVQELGAAHIVTAIVVIETTWVNLEARSTHSEAHSWNCFMFMLGVERNLSR